MSGVGAAASEGSKPTPSRLTVNDGFAGSSVFTVNVPLRAPPPDGLKRIVRSRWFPAPMAAGREGGDTTVKSAAFGPVIGSEFRCKSQSAHDDWFEMRSTWSLK